MNVEPTEGNTRIKENMKITFLTRKSSQNKAKKQKYKHHSDMNQIKLNKHLQNRNNTTNQKYKDPDYKWTNKKKIIRIDKIGAGLVA